MLSDNPFCSAINNNMLSSNSVQQHGVNMAKQLLLVTDDNNPLFDALVPIAEKHGISIEQLALRYIAIGAGAESDELPQASAEQFSELLNNLT